MLELDTSQVMPNQVHGTAVAWSQFVFEAQDGPLVAAYRSTRPANSKNPHPALGLLLPFRQLWFHVDAAAGNFAVSPTGTVPDS